MKEREFRSVPMNIECRSEVREGGPEVLVAEGYASTFAEYLLWEDDECKFFEQIDPRAFDECDFSDCVYRKDHEGTVFARTSNGTLRVSVDNTGLWNSADLTKTTAARAMYEEIKEGMYPQMSFAFTVAEDVFTRDENGDYHRLITKVQKCYDVSPVTWPANPGTSVGVRSIFDGAIKKELEECEARAKAEALEARKAELLKRLGKEE